MIRAVGAAVVVWLFSAAAAQGALSRPVSASALDVDAAPSAVAMNPVGERSALVYAGPIVRSSVGRVVLVARLGRGRRFSHVQRLENRRRGTGNRARVEFSDVRVSVAPDGGAVAVWLLRTATRTYAHPLYRLRVARALPGHRFGRPRTALRTTRPYDVSGLVAGRGGLAVVALRRDERAQVLVGRRGRPLGRPRDLGASIVYAAPPSLALSSRGIVLAAWSPGVASIARVALLAPDAARFGAARTLSETGESASYAAAVAGPGGAGVAWTTHAMALFPTPDSGRVRFARLSSTGTFAAPATLADVTITGVGQVALPRGGAAATWRTYIDKTFPGDSDYYVDSQLFAHAALTGDPATRTLSQLPAAAFRPVVAALGSRALIVWREAAVTTIGTRIRLSAARPGGWAPTATVADGGIDIQTTPETGIVEDEHPASDPSIAAGHTSALVTWTALVRRAGGERLHRVRLATYHP